MSYYLITFEGWYGYHPKESHIVHPRLFSNASVAREWAEEISCKYNIDYFLHEIRVDVDYCNQILLFGQL